MFDGFGFHDVIIALFAYLSLSISEELAFHGYPFDQLEACGDCLTRPAA
jgi:hypothetical protein